MGRLRKGIKFLILEITDGEHLRLKLESAVSGKPMAEIVRDMTIRPLMGKPLDLDLMKMERR
jgi:hypothetical protein